MDSLKKRYFIKLAKSSTDALINVLLLLFVPRTLGPAAYGSFNFIRNIFQSIIALSDLNMGTAHINYAARKENSNLASSIYFSYILFVGAVVLVFISCSTLTGLNHYVFPEQKTSYLFLGALLAYLMYVFTALMGLSDSKGATYGFEFIGIGVSVVWFGVLVALYFTHALNLTTFFMQRITMYVVLLVFCVCYVRKKVNLRLFIVNPVKQEVRLIIREFFSFSYPLITLSVLGIIFGFFDRWFLQMMYGSVSQGFFSLAYSLSSIAGLFLAPMTPLLMQSVAKADENGDLLGIKNAFKKVELLYLIGAFLSIFFMFHTTEIIALIGGKAYDAAWLTMLVMFLYPIHVVYGQFCGGVLLALRKTALYRNIALVSTVIGVIITYFLLAPRSFFLPGLELGSLGLALKLVLIQFFSVTVQLYFVCKLVEEKMSRYLLSQLVIPIPVIVIGASEWFVRKHMILSLHGPLENGLSLAVSMVLWMFIIGGIIWRFPGLVGIEKSVLRGVVHQILSALRSKPQ
ncbi:MAG: oligosaccharide flippase family protein [Legionellaceae bacterium]|nr:oligosaccharide flippase family protein [Legionellaceae bacterium]